MEPDAVTAAFFAYTKAVESMDRAALLAVLSDDVIQVDPYPSDPNVGHAAVAAFFEATWSMAEKLEITLGRSVVGGDRGAFPFTVRSVLPGGGSVEVDVIDVVKVGPDGKISELMAFVDLAGMRSL